MSFSERSVGKLRKHTMLEGEVWDGGVARRQAIRIIYCLNTPNGEHGDRASGIKKTTNGEKVNRENRKAKVERRGRNPVRSEEGGTEEEEAVGFISLRQL